MLKHILSHIYPTPEKIVITFDKNFEVHKLIPLLGNYYELSKIQSIQNHFELIFTPVPKETQ